MYSFLLSKIEVGSHLYVNFSDTLHLHGETVGVSALVVLVVSLFLVLGTSNLNRVPQGLQNVTEVVYELVKSIAITQMGPSNDINTTACLAILTSLTYFSAGFKIKGIGYFKRYIKPAPFFLPINIVEDFTKPLSLNFRLFGNVVADELTVTVICSLVPLIIPLPIMMLGLFASSLQALIFATLAAAYIGEVIE